MLTDVLSSLEDANLIDRLVDSELSTDQSLAAWHRIAVGVKVDIALDIDATLVDVVDLWDVTRQEPQDRLFGDPEGPG